MYQCAQRQGKGQGVGSRSVLGVMVAVFEKPPTLTVVCRDSLGLTILICCSFSPSICSQPVKTLRGPYLWDNKHLQCVKNFRSADGSNQATDFVQFIFVHQRVPQMAALGHNLNCHQINCESMHWNILEKYISTLAVRYKHWISSMCWIYLLHALPEAPCSWHSGW